MNQLNLPAPISPTAPRGVWTLSPRESVWAFAAAAAAWFALFYVGDRYFALPVWAPLVVCNALAASAVCACRFWGEDATRSVSPLGYIALACPLVQAISCVFIAFGLLHADWLVTLASFALFVAFLMHLCVSAIASVLASLPAARHADNRGDLAVFPLFLAWVVLVGALVVSVDTRVTTSKAVPENDSAVAATKAQPSISPRRVPNLAPAPPGAH